MKVITLWQPWATFIALGWKTIETRTHQKFAGLVGQRIGIHAGMTFDKRWEEAAGFYLSYNQKFHIKNLIEHNLIPYGKIICTALICKSAPLNDLHSYPSLIDCKSMQRYGLFLCDIKFLPEKIEAKGHQGIWEYDLPITKGNLYE